MRTLLSFVLLAFIIKTSSAQSTRIGITFQPNLTYFTIRPDASSMANDFKLQNKPLVRFQVGITLFRQLSDKLTFSSGISYSERGFKSQFNTSTISAFNLGSGYSLKVIDRYLEIPIVFNYYLSKNEKTAWFISGGLKPAIYLNSVSKADGVPNSSNNFYYSAHRKINLFATVGFGAEINISEQCQLILWPALEQALLKEVYAAPLSLYPYSIGLNVCLVFSLGN